MIALRRRFTQTGSAEPVNKESKEKVPLPADKLRGREPGRK